MYNQLLYFIVALLIFTIQQPGSRPFLPPGATALAFLALFGIYVALCRRAFNPLRLALEEGAPMAWLSRSLQGVQARLSILGLLFLACHAFVLNVNFYLQTLPGFQWSQTLYGAAGLVLYMAHLVVIWVMGHPVHQRIHGSTRSLAAHVWGSASFQLAILVPWLLISILADLVEVVKKPPFFSSNAGQIFLSALMMAVFISLGPSLVVRLWGCKTLPEGPLRTALEAFCRRHRFSIADFKLWPAFGGELLTAGIMGILPGLRYILVTRGLLALLDREELEAVVAHEMGHIKRWHLPFYMLLFLGFFAMTLSYHDIYLDFVSHALYQSEALLGMAMDSGSAAATFFSFVYAAPMLVVVVFFFRYVFGFFMRNSERQADLHALGIVGHPHTLISSLEKIAYASGSIRDLPSWHHYGIGERIDFLRQSYRNPALSSRHDRKLYGAAALFLGLAALLAWTGPLLEQSALARHWRLEVWVKTLDSALQKEPDNPAFHMMLGGLLLERKQYGEAEDHLLRALELAPEDPVLLNNLAWLYATAPPPVANSTAALRLAEEAVRLKPEPFVWDTLAEAYHVNGLHEAALAAIEQAIRDGTDNREHYLRQKERFQKAMEE
ncbi:MAG: M48 family metalloprotease [Syntrophobacteraceae bacterium]|jgi:Zn-dependent protease with chaperone function|nr:M48 family metalloprotease [Syntrophobacteraceae bacterium]